MTVTAAPHRPTWAVTAPSVSKALHAAQQRARQMRKEAEAVRARARQARQTARQMRAIAHALRAAGAVEWLQSRRRDASPRVRERPTTDSSCQILVPVAAADEFGALGALVRFHALTDKASRANDTGAGSRPAKGRARRHSGGSEARAEGPVGPREGE
ncbi:hypothetical protein GCM10010358_39380 [Streptomyces minutiscleroticus]|uniref:Uncharacterized protein n=1 Tax=Streptomyces minutiscleroticus TaxID=68238 RepID=A0A918U1B5_9ACTN|nr:hypothetical protein GCM10010358_39380 [Streptomyces minutiscleroticus]